MIARGDPLSAPQFRDCWRLVRFGYGFRVHEARPKQNIRPGSHAASTSSRPETPSDFEHYTASSAQRFFIHPPDGPKARIGDGNTLSLRNQPLTLLTRPHRCTLLRGGNSLWSLSDLGSVPHLACSSRIGPFPRSRRPGPPIGVFWLCSACLPPNRLEVEATTTTQAGASPFGVMSDAMGGRRALAPGPPGPCPGDASCQKGPPDASPNFYLPPQLTEKEQVTSHE